MACIYTYKGQEFQTKQEIIDFIKTNKINPSTVNLARDVVFTTRSTGFTTVQQEEVTNTLAYAVFNFAKGDIENFGSTDFTKVISAYLEKRIISTKGTAYQARFMQVAENVPFFVEQVKLFYKNKGIEIIEELVETEDGNMFIENTLLVDPKQNATSKIRAMVSLIPKYTRSEEGRSIPDKDTFLGTSKFVEEGAMWNTLKSGLSDIAHPTLEKMFDKLDEMSKNQPHIGKIKSILNTKRLNPLTGKEEVDESLRTQFFNAFALSRINYMSILLVGDPGSMSVRVTTTDPSSQEAVLVRQWVENFSSLMSNTSGDTAYFESAKLDAVVKSYLALSDKVNNELNSVKRVNAIDTTSVRGKNSNKVSDGLKEDLLKLFDSMGIEMNKAGLNNLLRDKSVQSDQGTLTIFKLKRLLGRDGVAFLIKDIEALNQESAKNKTLPVVSKDGISPIEDNKIVKLLAQKQGEALQDLSDSMTLGAEGNLYSNYSTHTLVSSLISQWNANSTELDSVTNASWGYASRIAKWMKENPNNKLNYYVLNNFKALGKNDQGDKISNLSEPEAIAASLNIILSDGKTATYTGLAEADKSKQIVLKGGKFESAGLAYRPGGLNSNERFTLSNENATEILSSYFANEVVRMRAIYENLYGQKAIPESERVMYLHTDKNTHTSYLFPEFNKPDAKGITPLERFGIVSREKAEDGTIRMVPKKLTADDILSNRNLNFAIRESFLKAVQSDVSVLESNKIIERDVRTTNTGVELHYKNIAIDKSIIANRYKDSIVNAVADYTLNSIIGSIETTMLFTGDPASYKNSAEDLFKDFRKRVPAVISGGIKSRIYKNTNTGEQDVRSHYTSAVVSSIEAPSDYFYPNKKENTIVIDRMLKAFNEGKPKEEQATRADIVKLISAYKEVNIADAQAWITLDAFKERMKSWGKWNNSMQDAYERMTAKNPVLLPQDVKLFMQPLKTVHVEETSKYGHRYLQYLKQSEAVIIPGLFPGLETLQKANPTIDHFVTLDGKKVGASGVTPINEGSKLLPTDQIKLNSVKMSYDRLYLQQDLPTKQVKDTLVGSQVVKNLLGEILLEGTYEIPLAGGKFKTITGAELVDQYHEVVGLLSDLGYNNLAEEFGFNEDTGTVDKNKFTAFLAKAMEDELTVSEMEALDSGLSIDALPSVRKKLESKLLAEVRKKTIKLKQLGGAMVQMSSFGTISDMTVITGKVKDGIIFLKDVREGLLPMQLNEDENGKLYTEKAQILLPHKYIRELLGDDYKNLTPDEIKRRISPDVLMGISYRIPNQATSSNDLFEIVGILPPEAGDTVIAYNEITAKTGSDFDIDKAFIILPNIEVNKKGKLVRPKYAYEMSVEEAYQEKYEKDWRKSYRAREISIELEAGVADKKQIIIDKLKELKGLDQVRQDLRNEARIIEEDLERSVITEDLVNLLSRYFSGDSTALAPFQGKTVAESIQLKNNMMALKEELTKINNVTRAEVKKRLEAEGKIPSLAEFKTWPEIKQHSKAALENLRIDLMQALLGDPKTYPNAVAALDNKFLELEAKDLYSTEGGASSKNLGFFRGTTQAMTKVLFDKAKSLVGIVANQMTDHKVSQRDGLTYRGVNFQIGKQKSGESLVSSITDVNGTYTATWLNLYMNAIVDAAKDPYIIAANINQFTAPVGFMLIRTGVPAEWVNAYLGQPILKELVKLKSIREGRLSQKVYGKDGKKLTPEQELINKYMNSARITAEEFEALSLKDLKKIDAQSLKREIKGQSNALKQLIILKGFNEFKETSKELSEAIRAGKADVTNGKDLISAELKEAKLIQLIEKNAIRNIEVKFGVVTDNNKIIPDDEGFAQIDGTRMAGTFHRNGIQSAARMFSGMSVMSSGAVRNILYNIIFDMNPNLINQETEVDALMNEIYSFIIGIEGSGITDGKVKDLFFGDNSTARKVERLKRAEPTLALNNILLRDFTTVYRKEKGDPDFLTFNNKNQDRELYQRAWSELFETHPAIAKELVNYSYHASGFNRNLFSFFQFIPVEELVNRNFGSFMTNINTAFSSAGNTALQETGVLTEASDQVIRHLWGNKKIVPSFSSKDIEQIEKLPTTEIFTVKDKSDFVIGVNEHEAIETTRFLRDKNDNLYELVGYNRKKDPIYKRTNKLGYYDKGKVVKEYFTKQDSTELSPASIFAENNVSLSKQTQSFLNSKDYLRFQPVASRLKDSILYRTNKKSEISDKEVTEAIKNCKV